MSSGPQRLDGWKAIAGHFHRDRTTVMRWEKLADLPVRRVPGDSASVYAFVDELDAWLEAGGSRRVRDAGKASDPAPPLSAIVPSAGDKPAASSTPPEEAPRGRRIITVAIVAGVLAVAVAAMVLRTQAVSSTPRSASLPHDRQLAQLYVQARDDWASRTPEGIRKALSELATVTRGDPHYAPGFSGLADTYLLAREFAGMPSDVAYAKAEAAAKVALEIDPRSSDAARDMGFIDYYWRQDNQAARAWFAKALKADPASAQTYLWYGNALSDNGETEAGLRMLEQARLRDPGSTTIEADYDFALWKAGRVDEAKRRLAAMIAQAPNLPNPHTFLSTIALIERDFPTYLREAEIGARLTRDRARLAELAAEREALASGGAPALFQALGRDWAAAASWREPPRRNETILAALAGDHPRAMTPLREADASKEIWRGMGWVNRSVGDLRNAPGAGALLDRRRPPALAPDGRF